MAHKKSRVAGFCRRRANKVALLEMWTGINLGSIIFEQ